MSKISVLDHITAKGNNKRITVLLVKDDTNLKCFRVLTKTLINFKDRNILNE